MKTSLPQIPQLDKSVYPLLLEALAALWERQNICQALFFDERIVNKNYIDVIPNGHLLISTGLLSPVQNEYYKAEFRLQKISSLLVFSDLTSSQNVAQVFPFHPENYYFYSHMCVEEGMKCLDLGPGSGVLSLLASAMGALSVLGIDINPRAVEMSRFNALLNNIDNCTFIEADYFDYLQKSPELFDYVLSNPPFEPGPVQNFDYYRHSYGGIDGLEIVDKQLRKIPQLLSNKSVFQLVTFSPKSDRAVMVPQLLDLLDENFGDKVGYSFVTEYSSALDLKGFGERYQKFDVDQKVIKEFIGTKNDKQMFICSILIRKGMRNIDTMGNWQNPSDINGIGSSVPMGHIPKTAHIPLD